jgi:hypothetical protein
MQQMVVEVQVVLDRPQTIPDSSPVQQYGEPEVHRFLEIDSWAAGQLVGVDFDLASRPSSLEPALVFALFSPNGMAMLTETYVERTARKVAY